ncbi:MAG: septum formation initiator family protein [Cytophagia bacterium]|nr:MAG: septum formation initiator family protein [Cytophagales bacterium]TAG05138.1 MAG: septum formation initiator family protein [Cytophagia bacterium]TAG44175.1 MAG: septum formation initiator family protein [Cytophagia bacterium]TAH29563.1 MAG: septum formation initiator family protein [Cytophagales bacterium]
MNLIKIPKFLKNFYLLSGILFIIWMLFFDANDWITQYNRQKKLQKMEEEKLFYKKRTEEVKADFRDLKNNAEVLERFAREKYYLKKPKEEVFILTEDEKKIEKK